eukprot:scaffold8577_cov62-Cylindrotheca_fusiformis.AAC.1
MKVARNQLGNINRPDVMMQAVSDVGQLLNHFAWKREGLFPLPQSLGHLTADQRLQAVKKKALARTADAGAYQEDVEDEKNEISSNDRLWCKSRGGQARRPTRG